MTGRLAGAELVAARLAELADPQRAAPRAQLAGAGRAGSGAGHARHGRRAGGVAPGSAATRRAVAAAAHAPGAAGISGAPGAGTCGDAHAAYVAEVVARRVMPVGTDRHRCLLDTLLPRVRLFPRPDRLGRPGIESHLVDVLDLLAQPDRPGLHVDDVDHLGQQLGRVFVARLVGQRHGPAQLGRRGFLVALLTGLQPVLDGGGELGLAGVVRDPRVDLGGQGLVVGPDGPDQALAGHRGARRPPGHQAHPGREHLLPDAGRGDLAADVVVAALPRPPGPGRVIAGLRTGR